MAQRYATALFDLAGEDGARDEVAGDLDRLDAMIDESPDFAEVLRNPVLSRKEQEDAVLAVAEKAGVRDLTEKFLGVLAQHRRLAVLPEIGRAYRAMLATSRGEVTAEVTSAKPLDDDQRTKLKSAIERYVGQSVTLEADVDKALLGGLVVTVGSRMLDASLKTKLQQLEQSMKGIG